MKPIDWPVRAVIRPGLRGTKAEHEKYLDDLVAVRYRYDDETGMRVKTVEIVVDKRRKRQI